MLFDMDIIFLVALLVEIELFLYPRASGHYYLNTAAKVVFFVFVFVFFFFLLAYLGEDVRFY